MDFIQETLFGVNFTSYESVLLKLLVWLLICTVVIFILWWVVNQLWRQPGIHRDHFLQLSFLRSLSLFLILFSVYVFFLIRQNGLHSFQWENYTTYLAIAPQLLIFLGIIVFFIVSYNNYTKLIND